MKVNTSLRINAPEGCFFAGEYGCNWHIVQYATLQINNKISPICKANPILIEKKAYKLFPHLICCDCLSLLGEKNA